MNHLPPPTKLCPQNRDCRHSAWFPAMLAAGCFTIGVLFGWCTRPMFGLLEVRL